MSERNFFAELKRRNVYKVAVAYAVVGWLLLQLGSILFPTFDAPSWVMKVFVALVAAGFAIALVVAWAFELTPEGIARTDEAGRSPRRRGGRAWIYVVLIGAGLSIGLFFLGRYTASAPGMAAASDASKSIAVLPLVNQSGDPAQEYFSDGLSEELINVLGQIRELRVIGRNSSFRFKGRADASRAIGEALGVANVLEGSVRKAGDRVRISVQLVDTSTDSQRWSQTYDRELKDVFAVQEEIAKSVAGHLRLTLVGDAGNALARPGNLNLEAYNNYLQGMFYFRQRNEQAFARALPLFNEAIRRDPNYAEAFVAKARTLYSRAVLHGVKGRGELEQAEQAAMAALALKPDVSLAHAILGYIYIAGWNLAAAEAELSRPQVEDDFVLSARATLRKAVGDPEQAVAMQRKAVELDPAFVVWHVNLANTLLLLGQYDEAESTLRKAAELQPQANAVHALASLLAVLRGQGDVALREAQLESDEIGRAMSVALAQHARGDKAEADAALERLIASHGDNAPMNIALAYAGRGENDKVFEWLNRAYEARQPTLIFHLVSHPLLKRYHSDPRFVELCRKTNVPPPK